MLWRTSRTDPAEVACTARDVRLCLSGADGELLHGAGVFGAFARRRFIGGDLWSLLSDAFDGGYFVCADRALG